MSSKQRTTAAATGGGGIEMGNIGGGTTNSSDDISPERIATERIQDYSSVNVDDQEEDYFSDEDDMNSNGNRRQRHRRRRPPPQGGMFAAGGMVWFSWIALLFVLGAIVAGLLFYRRVESSRHENNNNNNNNGNNNLQGSPPSPSGSGSNSGGMTSSNSASDKTTTITPPTSIQPSTRTAPPVHYDLNFMTNAWNPFDLQSTSSDDDGDGDNTAFAFSPPTLPWMMSTTTNSASNNEDNDTDDDDDDDNDAPGAFFMQPDIVNNTLVFVSEGDLYMTRLLNNNNDVNDEGKDGSAAAAATAAMKLTTTVGNVRTPKLHPTLPLVAFTATYTGRRDVYLQDWRTTTQQQQQQQQDTRSSSSSSSSGRASTTIRLTYWDHEFGVSKVVGWKDDKTLLLAAFSTAVSLPDVRLFELTLAQDDLLKTMASSSSSSTSTSGQRQQQPVVMEIAPVPLAQALEGVYHHDHDDDDAVTTSTGHDHDDDCLYFTRVQQSSHTIRYIGGTAENLWVYCAGQELALPLTSDYNGTSKNPTIYYDDEQQEKKKPYLFFLSDRSLTTPTRPQFQTWTATNMNLWAMPLPSRKDVTEQYYLPVAFPLTAIACQFKGRSLREYSVDPVTQDVILRIGVDLYRLTRAQILETLRVSAVAAAAGSSSSSATAPVLPKPTRLSISVYSDFHEMQERVIPVKIIQHLKNADVFETPVVLSKTATATKHATALLLTLRGQTFVAPIVAETKATVNIPYQGAGQNLPQRRYRVAPGTFTAGAMRVLNSLALPVLVNQDDNDDDSTTKNKRFAILLATDPLSATAEHAFYMVRIDTGAPNAFADLEHGLPEPFLGGGSDGFVDSSSTSSGGGGGGSTAHGGLGSVRSDSLTISPCGRRMAWTDTDARICVMTIPLYQSNKTDSYTYTVLPQENELGEPMTGLFETKLSWSPGGRYLAVNHLAGNQFNIISIVDCGSPEPPVDETASSNNNSTTGKVADIEIGRIVQASPSRFNSFDPYWGTTIADAEISKYRKLLAQLFPDESKGEEAPATTSTTLYFLTDRNIVSDVISPWGNRAPLPHFPAESYVYALPLTAKTDVIDTQEDDESSSHQVPLGRFSGGGAMEVIQDELDALTKVVTQYLLAKEAEAATSEAASTGGDNTRRLSDLAEKLARALVARGYNSKTGRRIAMRLLDDDSTVDDAAVDAKEAVSLVATTAPTMAPTTTADKKPKSPFPVDMDIDFGPQDLTWARQAYRLPQVPRAKYATILSQTSDDSSIALVEVTAEAGSTVKVFMTEDYPFDAYEEIVLPLTPHSLLSYGISTCRKHILLILGPDGATKVIPNTIVGLASAKADFTGGAPTANIADTTGLALSVWPALEYKQMFNDAWRMFRDFFYDTNLHSVDWPQMHKRYSGLVKRCTKREELDDVLVQLAEELSALHVFVYGGEYNSPFEGNLPLQASHVPGSLGVTLQRKAAWKGYMIMEIPYRDPDFNMVELQSIYSPLSDQALRPTGQKGLQAGDVIVGINGESVFRAPDIHMLLRGMAGHSVRLEVLRLASSKPKNATENEATPEPVIVTPIDQAGASNLRYSAWEWKTRLKAKALAKDAGFTVGYVHLRSMQRDDMDQFARSFFEDYDKQTFILDVRHNKGGNIDSWISTMLQRKAWNYFGARSSSPKFRTGDSDWNQHFAFRGHIVVLIDEKTSSDGEGISRSMSELGLGRLIGTRTWGGGIWLSSDNHLVDGGIATAPEIGTFNEKWGWGTGVEMTGVSPDVHVDNNPRTAYDGVDTQLERAIAELKQWLEKEPVVEPKFPGPKPDMSLKDENCPA